MRVASLVDPHAYRRRASDYGERVRAWRDRRRASARFPMLAHLDGALAELRPFHERYTATVSSAVMAVSLELAAFLLAFCRATRPARVADLGSGLTSFVLRYWQRAATPRPEVWSVDDDGAWLERTRAFLAGSDVGTEHLVGWTAFRAALPRRFDLVVHDLGTLTVRAQTLAAVFDLVEPGGVLVLDDMHDHDFRCAAYAHLGRRGVEVLSLRRFLRDGFGRYPAAALRPP